MPNAQFSNACILQRAEQFRADLNSGSWIQLFQNDIIPDSATLKAAFIPCNFPGYAPVSLTDAIPAPKKVEDGLYRLLSGPFAFEPTADDEQFAYGFFVQTGASLMFSQRFEFPLPIFADTPLLFPLLVNFRSVG